MAEFTSTLNWFKSPASEVSAHIVVAAGGTIAEVIDPDYGAWHDPSSNTTMLGIEMVQPHLGDEISELCVQSVAWWLLQMSQRYGFLLDEAHLPYHSSTPSGIQEGKSDAYPRNSADGAAFRVRLMKYLH